MTLPASTWEGRSSSFKTVEAEKKFGTKDIIPLWIADMDFPTARPIIDAMAERNKNGIFGYTSRSDSYFESVRDWQAKRNGWTFDTALASFCPGVVPALAVIVDRFSGEGDDILFLLSTKVWSGCRTSDNRPPPCFYGLFGAACGVRFQARPA